MPQPLEPLRRADQAASAADIDLALLGDGFGIAHRATVGKNVRGPRLVAGQILDDLRDDVTGALDRKRLAAIVFRDAAARQDLESIIHPAVRLQIDAWFASLAPVHRFAIADIPLLYETGRDRDFDAVIVTTCEPAAQVRRVMTRDGVTEPEARQRIAAQMPTEDKIRRATYVIRTDGTFEDTSRQVLGVYNQLGAEH